MTSTCSRLGWPGLLAFMIAALGPGMGVAAEADARPFSDRVDDLYDVLQTLDFEERAEFCSAYPDLDDSDEARDWVRLQQATCRSVLTFEDPHPDMYFYAARLQYRSGFLRHKVHEYLQTGAEQGSVKALTALGWMDYTRNEDYEAMLAAYERAAAMGDPVAMTELGRYLGRLDYMRMQQDRPHEHVRAFQLFEEASDMGYPMADLMLGRLQVIKSNMDTAETYLRSAAEAGVEHAYHVLQREGFEVDRPDDDTAFRYPSLYPWDLVMYRRPEHAPEGAFVRSNAKRD